MKSDSGRLRVVVDTNLFVSGLLNSKGQPYQLLQALRAGAFTVLMSVEQRAELDRVLHRQRLIKRYHLPTEDRDTLLSFLDTVASPVTLSTTLPVTVRDAKDEIILITAVEGAANYPVTGDDDFLTLNGTLHLAHSTSSPCATSSPSYRRLLLRNRSGPFAILALLSRPPLMYAAPA